MGMRGESPSIEHYICLQEPAWPDVESYETLVTQGRGEEVDNYGVGEDDTMSIFFTAGTTGKPKGAVRTHRHLMSNAVATVIELKVDYDDRALITFPLYHVAGEDNIVRHTFMANTFYIKREGGFDPADVLRYISRERVPGFSFFPP